ncbi:MAG: phage major capsid protein [Chloroflexota bacterium]
MDLTEMRQKRGDIIQQANAIIEAAPGSLTDADRRQLDQLKNENERLKGDIQRLELFDTEAREERAAREPGGPPPMRPDVGDDNQRALMPRLGATGPRYRDMFGAPRATGVFRSFGDFLTPFSRGQWDPRYTERALGDVGSSAGLLIPPEYTAELFDKSLESEVVRPRARIEPMVSDVKHIAGFRVDPQGAATDEPFGVKDGWKGPGATLDSGTLQTRAVILRTKKLGQLVEITSEALEDGPAVDDQVSEALMRGLGWLLDFACLRGTGAGMPLGILNSPSLVTVAAEGGQTAGTVVWANVVKMLARLTPGSYAKSVWVVNPSVIPQLLQMTIPAGTAGISPGPVLTERSGEFVLATRPVVFSEKMSALGTLGDIMLADFSQYVIGLRKEIQIEKSIHPGFTKDTQHYRAIIRVDGMPLWGEPYTPAFGSTLSPFVTLAAR